MNLSRLFRKQAGMETWGDIGPNIPFPDFYGPSTRNDKKGYVPRSAQFTNYASPWANMNGGVWPAGYIMTPPPPGAAPGPLAAQNASATFNPPNILRAMGGATGQPARGTAAAWQDSPNQGVVMAALSNLASIPGAFTSQ